MIDRNGNLNIFEDFRIDRTLPKYRPKPKGDQVSKYGDSGDEMMMNPVSFTLAQGSEVRRSQLIINTDSEVSVVKPTFWQRLWGRKVPSEPEPTLTIQQFFASVKNTAKELEVVEERAAGYERAMVTAHQAGQQALYEQLQAGLNAYKQVTQLLAMGLSRYVQEADVVRFYKESPRGLRLDWVSNFTRVIPDSVVATKVRADELGIFDNYVVLHYDPEAKSYAETEREKEAKKDPILFGLIKGKRVLYFVGDWVDNVCDLTLDQLADKLGSEAIKVVER